MLQQKPQSATFKVSKEGNLHDFEMVAIMKNGSTQTVALKLNENQLRLLSDLLKNYLEDQKSASLHLS